MGAKIWVLGGYGPQPLGTVGTDEHPITVTTLPAQRQYRLTCECGWAATAVTWNHAQVLSGRHAPEPVRE